MGKRTKADRRADRDAVVVAALEEVYAQVPAIECAGACHDSCGPIAMTHPEWRRAKAAGVDIPNRSHRTAGPVRCPALSPVGRCLVYAARPIICRLWGVWEPLPCTYGCRPARYLSTAQGYLLIAQVHEIGGDLVRAGLILSQWGDPETAARSARALRELRAVDEMNEQALRARVAARRGELGR